MLCFLTSCGSVNYLTNAMERFQIFQNLTFLEICSSVSYLVKTLIFMRFSGRPLSDSMTSRITRSSTNFERHQLLTSSRRRSYSHVSYAVFLLLLTTCTSSCSILTTTRVMMITCNCWPSSMTLKTLSTIGNGMSVATLTWINYGNVPFTRTRALKPMLR